ncbi:hypothetical protein M422DRAFT_275334 [Sphaerobolus stellatus SS14]|uniref:Unplaced genomic scaffold SPHSTscaffold_475, whole genome shotgun sequence n=1 Tax=Sphaerobolus stellatus (strain SS14) TaxID=990650 RepID=A0A0C9T566_SPHS4|nr:hypothetical protein M422DRAFT_275334 [Sphaerobolus stellatus SS14]
MSAPTPPTLPHIAPYLKKSFWRGITPRTPGFLRTHASHTDCQGRVKHSQGSARIYQSGGSGIVKGAESHPYRIRTSVRHGWVQIQCDLPELAERIDDDDRAILYEYGCTDDLETQVALGGSFLGDVTQKDHRIDLIIALLLLSAKQKAALETEAEDAILFTQRSRLY